MISPIVLFIFTIIATICVVCNIITWAMIISHDAPASWSERDAIMFMFATVGINLVLSVFACGVCIYMWADVCEKRYGNDNKSKEK